MLPSSINGDHQHGHRPPAMQLILIDCRVSSVQARTGSQKVVFSPYESLRMRAVILSKCTGSSLPSLLTTYMVVNACVATVHLTVVAAARQPITTTPAVFGRDEGGQLQELVALITLMARQRRKQYVGHT